MGRRKQRPVAPAEPRSANADPMFLAWLEMSNLAGSDSRGTGMSYSMQRALARTPTIAAIKQTFINWGADFAQPQQSPYSIGWRVAKTNRRVPYTPTDWRTIDEISEVVQRAGAHWYPGGFEAYVKSSINDTITHDQVNTEYIRDEAGKPWAFIPVDPSTIRRAIPTDIDDDDAPRWDYEDIAFVQVMRIGHIHQVVEEFTRFEMHQGIRRNSSWISRLGYGIPELEEIGGIIANIVNCITSNAVGITTGVHANQLIWANTKMPETQKAIFREELQAMLSGVRNNKRTPVVFGNPDNKDEIKAIPLGQTNQEMEYSVWMDFLERLVCAIYNVDAQVVFPRVITHQQRGTNQQQLSPTDRALMSKERGFRPILRSLGSWLNEGLVSYWPGYRFDFVGFDSQSERDKLEMDIKAVTTYLSPNELRAERNLAPFDDPVSNRPLSPLYQAWIQAQVDQGADIPGLDLETDNISAWVNGRRLPDPTAAA